VTCESRLSIADIVMWGAPAAAASATPAFFATSFWKAAFSRFAEGNTGGVPGSAGAAGGGSGGSSGSGASPRLNGAPVPCGRLEWRRPTSNVDATRRDREGSSGTVYLATERRMRQGAAAGAACDDSEGALPRWERAQFKALALQARLG
jgi:hypothetical protein